MATADVTIRGAGIFGLSIGWEMACRGARVRVVDPAGVGSGASGGVVGALSPHLPDRWDTIRAFQFDSLLRASDFWAEVAAVSGRDPGYKRSGRLQPLTDDGAVALAQARAEGAARHWGSRWSWQVVHASGLAGPLPECPTGLFIQDDFSARIHPRRALAALAAAITARGGSIIADSAEQGLLVEATGWQGLVDLSRVLGRPVGAGVKGQAVVFGVDLGDLPQIYAGGLHVVPHADGTVAVGSTTEFEFDAPNTVDAGAETLISRARSVLPILSDAPILERWAGVRPRASTRLPLIGAHPRIPGRYIANGGFKIGFGLAPGVAALMADLVLEGIDRVPDEFSTRNLIAG